MKSACNPVADELRRRFPDAPDGPWSDFPPPSPFDYLKVVLIGAVAVGVFWLGWTIDVPVLDWILTIAGGFFVAVVLFLLGAMMFGPRAERSG